MKEVLEIQKLSLDKISQAHELSELEVIRVDIFGKKGSLTEISKTLASLDSDARKDLGMQLNQAKEKINQALDSRRQLLENEKINKILESEIAEVSLAGRREKLGSIHPISHAVERIVKFFSSIGTQIVEGPECETSWYNFESLNIAKNHPARAMFDTFYLKKEFSNQDDDERFLLRTHTSSVQIRHMENHKPPVKIIAPGRVYRSDYDATHTPMFHQVEGLWIDKGISFADLKTTLIEFLQFFFEDKNLKIRMRPSYFPFTEPSAEVDISSKNLFNGKWIEVLGSGMVHPQVLKNMKIDPEVYSGFAFGVGVERLVMLKYSIDDLRILFDNDIEFLEQFK